MCIVFFTFKRKSFDFSSVMDFSDSRSQDMVLPLEDSGKGEVTGELYITASLLPKSQEDKELVSPQDTTFSPVI